MINFITLLEIADMLAEKLSFEDITAGNIDASLDKSMGVYLREEQSLRKCIGDTESYQTVKIRILVHWTKNPSEAEKQAYALSELLEGLSDEETNGHIIKFIQSTKVRGIGKDEKGVCEYVVDADIIYSDKEE